MDTRALGRIVGTGQQQALDALVDAVREVDLGHPAGPSTAWLDWIECNVPSCLRLVVVGADVHGTGAIAEHQQWHSSPTLPSLREMPAEERSRLRRDFHGLVLIDIDVPEADALVDAFGSAALGVIRITRTAAAGTPLVASDGLAQRLIAFVAPSDAKPGPLIARVLPSEMLVDCRRAWVLEQLMLLAQSVGRLQEQRQAHATLADGLRASSRDTSREQASLRAQSEELVELRELLEKELAAATSADDGSAALSEFRMTCEGDLRKLITDRFDELLQDVATGAPPKTINNPTTSTSFWGQQGGGVLTGLVGHSVTYKLKSGSLTVLAQRLAAQADAFLDKRVAIREERAIAKIFDFYREPLAALSVRIPEARRENRPEQSTAPSGTRAFSGLEGNLNVMLRREEERDLLHFERPSVVRSFMQARSLAGPLIFVAGLGIAVFGVGSASEYRTHFLVTGVIVALGYLIAMAATEKPRMRMELAEELKKLRTQLLEQLTNAIAAACQRIPADRKAALDHQVRHVRELIDVRIRALSSSPGAGQPFSIANPMPRPGLAKMRSDRSAASLLENALQALHDTLAMRIRSRR